MRAAAPLETNSCALVGLPDLIIALLSLGLALLAYLRPPDPSASDMLDFFSQTISIPIWVAGVVVNGLVAISGFVFRRIWIVPKPAVKKTLGFPDPKPLEMLNPPFSIAGLLAKATAIHSLMNRKATSRSTLQRNVMATQ